MLSKRKRDLQMADNCAVLTFYYERLPKLLEGRLKLVGQLYHCNARMYHTDNDNVVVLQSYKTIVAAFDIDESTVYDFSRYVYKYTPTTAQHVRKFANYLKANATFTWREVK